MPTTPIPKGMEFSPITELTAPFNSETDSICVVDNINAFPNVSGGEEGIIVLCEDPTFKSTDPLDYEVFTYTGRDTSLNRLTGVVSRAGVAHRVWDAGTKASCMWTNYAWSTIRNTVNHVAGEIDDRALLITQDETKYLPDDFATLQDAFEHYSKCKVSEGTQVTLVMKDTFQLSAGAVITNTDLGFIKLTCETGDGTVKKVHTNWPAYAGGTIDTEECFLIVQDGAVGPRLACIIDMDGKGLHGIVLQRNASMATHSDWHEYAYVAGVIGATHGRGALLRDCSTLYADWSRWDSNKRGVQITSGSRMSAQWSSFCNNVEDGVLVSRSSSVNFRAHDTANVNLRYWSKFNNNGSHGMRIYRSQAEVGNAEFEDNGDSGVWVYEGSNFSCVRGKFNDNGEHGLKITHGSRAYAREGEFNNNTERGCIMEQSSNLEAQHSEFVNNGNEGLYCMQASSASVAFSTITHNERGVFVANVSSVDLGGCTFSNNTHEDVRIRRGSNVNVTGTGILTEKMNIAAFNTLYKEGIAFVD